MATFTSKLGLEKPSSSDEVDIEKMNGNFDTLDKNMGANVVTSASRPQQPYPGMLIWETDTKQRRLWDGTAWIWDGGIRPRGTLRKIDGVQAPLNSSMSSPSRILMSPGTQGGFTFNSPSAGLNQLVIPENGLYEVAVYMHVTGGAAGGFVNGLLRNHNASNAFQNYIHMIRTEPKQGSNDSSAFSTIQVNYEKGWQVSFSASRSNGDTAMGVWGDNSEGRGTGLVITYIGPTVS